MARYKRYFPVSHDFFEDREVIALRKQFGVNGILVWLKILSILDSHENKLIMDQNQAKALSLAVDCRVNTILKIVDWIVNKGWITGVKMDDYTIYTSPNYMNYHRTRGRNMRTLGTTECANVQQFEVPPSLPLPILQKDEVLRMPVDTVDNSTNQTQPDQKQEGVPPFFGAEQKEDFGKGFTHLTTKDALHQLKEKIHPKPKGEDVS